MKRTALIILLFCLAAMGASAALTVFAASSTTDVMKELAAAYRERGGAEVRFNYAASGLLARQIEAGAPADLFLSADVKWMDYLADRKLLAAGTRTNLVNNSLVLVVPNESSLTYEGFPANLKGRLAVGDFRSVPAGAYAGAALQSLGWMEAVHGRLIKGANVRTVLMYVERGEVDAGIVYRTDALLSGKVKIIGTFPPNAHPPIVYPAACIEPANPESRRFLDFMMSGAGQAIWEKHGFAPLNH